MSKDQVANKAIRLIKEIYTNLSPKMREERVNILNIQV